MSIFKKLEKYENKKIILSSLILGVVLRYATGILNSPSGTSTTEGLIETSERAPSVIELETMVKELEKRIAEVEAVQQPQGLPRPDYDSGWLVYSPSTLRTLEHNLSSKDLLVYLVGKKDGYPVDPLDTWYTGGNFYNDPTGHGWYLGVQWTIEDENNIQVKRLIDDVHYNEIRVFIWKIPTTN